MRRMERASDAAVSRRKEDHLDLVDPFSIQTGADRNA
jgi:hypothetical protein